MHINVRSSRPKGNPYGSLAPAPRTNSVFVLITARRSRKCYPASPASAYCTSGRRFPCARGRLRFRGPLQSPTANAPRQRASTGQDSCRRPLRIIVAGHPGTGLRFAEALRINKGPLPCGLFRLFEVPAVHWAKTANATIRAAAKNRDSSPTTQLSRRLNSSSSDRCAAIGLHRVVVPSSLVMDLLSDLRRCFTHASPKLDCGGGSGISRRCPDGMIFGALACPLEQAAAAYALVTLERTVAQ